MSECGRASLSGKVAVVTGASAGIGRAIAVALAAAGVKVAVSARRMNLLEELVGEIKARGGEAIAVSTDIVDREQVRFLVFETEKAFGPIDILVNNAAFYYFSMMKNLREDTWNKTIDVNCKGTMNCIGAVLDGMTKRQGGHIVNISSDAGKKAYPGLTVYTGTKFFLEGMSQALRQEVAAYNIKVTTIQPGYVDTEGVNATHEAEALNQYCTWSQVTPLADKEVAETVVFALSQPQNVAVGEIHVKPLQMVSP